ncbi:MAG: NAD(P)H-dependent glycerol-3-phosphate dehydrogenase [Arenicella sp.]
MNNVNRQKISVLGAGSWGTALACLLADNGHEVTLWSHSPAHLQVMQQEKENKRHLPGFVLPENLRFDSDLKSICQNHTAFLIVVPSRAFAKTIDKMLVAGLRENSLIIWGSKGFDSENQQLLSHLIDQKVSFPHTTGVITGPSFALEVMQKHPTALTAGAEKLEIAKAIADLFHNDYVRVYANTDLPGVQIGGAVKNVLAIACGISDGLGFGANARSALITRGLTEIIRLGEKFHAKRETFHGLSGIGDLVLTCTDDKSRNRRFGLGIGRGLAINEVLEEIGQEVEGLVTSKEVLLIAKKHGVEMPICEQVYEIIHNNVAPKKAVKTLLEREAIFE